MDFSLEESTPKYFKSGKAVEFIGIELTTQMMRTFRPKISEINSDTVLGYVLVHGVVVWLVYIILLDDI